MVSIISPKQKNFCYWNIFFRCLPSRFWCSMRIVYLQATPLPDIYIYIYNIWFTTGIFKWNWVTPLADNNCIFFSSKKPHQKVWPSVELELTFSSKLDWGFYIISITETASKKTGALIRSMKFLSPEVSLGLYNSTIRPCMEYCCQVWVDCYLELLDKLQKRIWPLSKCGHLKSFL